MTVRLFRPSLRAIVAAAALLLASAPSQAQYKILGGAALGASALFWVMGVAVGAGIVPARHIGRVNPVAAARLEVSAPDR
jgi:hypothetical protein